MRLQFVWESTSAVAVASTFYMIVAFSVLFLDKAEAYGMRFLNVFQSRNFSKFQNYKLLIGCTSLVWRRRHAQGHNNQPRPQLPAYTSISQLGLSAWGWWLTAGRAMSTLGPRLEAPRKGLWSMKSGNNSWRLIFSYLLSSARWQEVSAM